MPSKVYNNVEGHRVIDNERVAEDVTSVSLPTIEHPTSTISSSGMAMDVDMPNTTHLNAMEFSVSHNNGVNCKYLASPGKHFIETRIVRQRYAVAAVRLSMRASSSASPVFTSPPRRATSKPANPFGSTDKYSVLRYEEEINGEVTTIIDAMAGVIKFNGVDYTNQIENLLN